MKKYWFLIFILTALLIPCFAFAEADEWDLTLPSSLTSIEESAFDGDTGLDRVYVSDGVESIGRRAFADSSLRDIRLPESLTEISPDLFINVPHVEVYGTWYDDFFAGMDNVAMSGAMLESGASVPIAGGQQVWRRIAADMDGEWII